MIGKNMLEREIVTEADMSEAAVEQGVVTVPSATHEGEGSSTSVVESTQVSSKAPRAGNNSGDCVPDAFFWTIDEVANWIEDIGYWQYKLISWSMSEAAVEQGVVTVPSATHEGEGSSTSVVESTQVSSKAPRAGNNSGDCVPDAFFWTIDEVANWIEDIGYWQYKYSYITVILNK
eukprot:sb/3471899/